MGTQYFQHQLGLVLERHIGDDAIAKMELAHPICLFLFCVCLTLPGKFLFYQIIFIKTIATPFLVGIPWTSIRINREKLCLPTCENRCSIEEPFLHGQLLVKQECSIEMWS